MQIVIDIPENIYEYYKNKYPKNCARLTFVENALLEGTPLPKGHDRLIDADLLKNQFSIWVDNFSSHVVNKTISKAHTIIKANKEKDE